MKIMSLVSRILFILAIGQSNFSFAYTKALFMGTIQFPSALKKVPLVRVYCGGNRITSQNLDSAKQATFTVPFEERRRTTFSLLITQTIKFQPEEGTNTIQYLKIDPEQDYKFYVLELIKTEQPKHIASDDFFNAEHMAKLNQSHPNNQFTYEWKIIEHTLLNGRIPDDTIIVCYNPDYIENLSGGNAVELPHIYIKDNVLNLAGSEAQLHDASAALLLSSLDTDAIHASIHQEVKHESQRTRVTMVTT